MSSSNQPNNAWIGFVVAGVVLLVIGLFVCVGVLLFFFGVGLWAANSSDPLTGLEPDIEVQPLVTPGSSGGSPDDPTPLPTPTLSPEEIEQVMSSVESEVARLRGLDRLADVPRAYLTPEELSERVTSDFLEDYTAEDARDDSFMLAALDVVDYGYDLYAFYVDLYSEGIAGFYDPEEDEFFLISSGASFTANDEWVFAHEYTHALQDQHFDLAAFLHYDDDEWYVEHAGEAAARQALIEGDATFTSLLYFQEGMSSERQAQLIAESESAELPAIYSTAPFFLLEDFFFPYEEGLAFIQTLWEQGGFDLIDQAYADPPISTEQILHPERYYDQRDDPQPVILPDALEVLPDSYREVVVQSFGEWYVQLYLAQFIEQFVAAEAAAGWDGDQLAVYVDESAEALVMLLAIVWDAQAEADEFAETFTSFGEAWSETETSFDIGGATCWEGEDVLCHAAIEGGMTLILRAPDPNTVSLLLQQHRVAVP